MLFKKIRDSICLLALKLEQDAALQLVLLGGITLLAAILRIYKLGEWSLWGDELITINRSKNIFSFTYLPSVSLILTNFALTIFGTSEWSSRIIPAVIGIATLPALFFPIRRLFGPACALLAMLFVAVSPWHIYWSQNARFYTSLLLFFNLAMFWFLVALDVGNPWYFLSSTIFFGFAFLERLTAFYLIPIIAIYLLTTRYRDFRKAISLQHRRLYIIFVPVVIVVAPLSIYVLNYMKRFVNIFNGLQINNPIWILGGSFYYIGLPVITFALLGLYYLITDKDRSAVLIGLSAFIPLLGTSFLSLYIYTANRYVFVSLVSWVLLAGVAIKQLLYRTTGREKILASGALFILVTMSMSANISYFVYQHGNRANWKAAFQTIKQNMEPGDAVVTANRNLADYYMGERTQAINFLDRESIQQLGQRIWIIEDGEAINAQPWLRKWLMENASLRGIHDVHFEARNFFLRVYLYDPNQ